MVGKALRVSLTNPFFAWNMGRFRRQFQRSNAVRKRHEQAGLMVPPFIIISITHSCNLKCSGCYARALHPIKGKELSGAEWCSVLEQAESLGVSFVVVLGGEPFFRKDLLEIVGRFPNLMFMVFTNGTFFDERVIRAIRDRKNIIPMLSVEGFENETDARRGKGIAIRINAAADLLKKYRVFYGASITASTTNLTVVSNESFIRNLHGMGCKVFFFIEYLPAESGTESLILSGAQKKALTAFIRRMRERFQAIFFDFPGDEYALGTCLSAGRGFIHISAEGNVEPCPFSPFSDSNLRTKTLRDSLSSQLFRKIREMPEEMSDLDGNCALFKKKEWVAAQAG
jgi:MoaA/NifB/PqqE/SkfB family radical SAM enzyme